MAIPQRLDLIKALKNGCRPLKPTGKKAAFRDRLALNDLWLVLKDPNGF